MSGRGSSNRVMERSASLRSLPNISRQHNQATQQNMNYDDIQAVNAFRDAEIIHQNALKEARETEIIHQRALEESRIAERIRNEALQNVEAISQRNYDDFEEPRRSYPSDSYGTVSNNGHRSIPNHVHQWVADHENQRDVSPVPSHLEINYNTENVGVRRHPLENTHTSFDNRDKLLSDAFKALTTNKKPRNLPEFSGSIKEWSIFFGEFERSTNEYNISNTENLRRLNDALKGDTRKTVYALLTHPENVNAIISVLTKNYGQTEWVIASLLNDMKNLQKLLQYSY